MFLKTKRKKIKYNVQFLRVNSVAIGDDGEFDEYERMSEHRQSARHQLREMQHHATAHKSTEAESCRPGDHQAQPEHR